MNEFFTLDPSQGLFYSRTPDGTVESGRITFDQMVALQHSLAIFLSDQGPRRPKPLPDPPTN